MDCCQEPETEEGFDDKGSARSFFFFSPEVIEFFPILIVVVVTKTYR